MKEWQHTIPLEDARSGHLLWELSVKCVDIISPAFRCVRPQIILCLLAATARCSLHLFTFHFSLPTHSLPIVLELAYRSSLYTWLSQNVWLYSSRFLFSLIWCLYIHLCVSNCISRISFECTHFIFGNLLSLGSFCRPFECLTALACQPCAK